MIKLLKAKFLKWSPLVEGLDLSKFSTIYRALMRENLSSGFENNKGADKCAQSGQHICYLLLAKYHISTCYQQNFNIATLP